MKRWLFDKSTPASERERFVRQSLRRYGPIMVLVSPIMDLLLHPDMTRSEAVYMLVVKPLVLAVIALPLFAFLQGRLWDRLRSRDRQQ